MDTISNQVFLNLNLLDKCQVSAFLQDHTEYTSLVSQLSYGWEPIAAYIWLQQKSEYSSSDIVKLCNSNAKYTLDTIIIKLHNLLKKDTLIREVNTPSVVGGNLILPKGVFITRQHVLVAYNLLIGAHPIHNYLHSVCGKGFGVNRLLTKDLSQLVSLIDFPIPSISYLLQVLNYQYLVDNPFLQKGLLIGICQDNPSLLFCCYGSKFKYYKCANYSVLASLIINDLIQQPMSRMEAIELEIETNHYI